MNDQDKRALLRKIFDDPKGAIAPGQLADPQVAAHPRSVQTFDRHLTNLDQPGTFPLQNLDKGGRSCVPPIYLQQRSSSSAP